MFMSFFVVKKLAHRLLFNLSKPSLVLFVIVGLNMLLG